MNGNFWEPSSRLYPETWEDVAERERLADEACDDALESEEE